jgi:SAM-dependent methyltransferase
MAELQIRFDDGAAYEQMMGVWSRSVGEIFLDWVAPSSGLRWLDVGCGNGAFTELVCTRCAPAEVHGIDPSDGQLAFARTRPGATAAQFHQGSAMALPFPDNSFDAASMALVIFFVPEPAKGVAEMVRVVAPGGTVAAYAWDLFGGGLPVTPIQAELRAMGVTPPWPPSPEASRIETMRALWTDAGLEAIETRDITVTRTFADFEEYWSISLTGAGVESAIKMLADHDAERLRERVRSLLPADATGRLTVSARANAVKGRMPK